MGERTQCQEDLDAIASKGHHRRRLRPLVITMGPERQSYIEELFAHPKMACHFEAPGFSQGIPSRSLRNRMELIRIAHEAGLIPDHEWNAIVEARNKGGHQDPERWFDCLKDVPIRPGRRGSEHDIRLHYSVELWRKAKGLNRGRTVLACILAHLMAMKRCVKEGYDFILEDNVRAPPSECAERIWATMEASEEWERGNSDKCHLRYYGWLGSIPNLQWVINTHSKRTAHSRNATSDPKGPSACAACSVFPFPVTDDFDSEDEPEEQTAPAADDKNMTYSSSGGQQKPGGTPIWGAYAYWVSGRALECLLSALQNDVGALLWKGKRMRCHLVKPIDKVLPRQIMASLGRDCIHVTTHPAFFRAPMLTSKIHKQWDAEFCKSTEYQLRSKELNWSDLWLSDKESQIVAYYEKKGVWLTMEQLMEMQRKESCESSTQAISVNCTWESLLDKPTKLYADRVK